MPVQSTSNRARISYVPEVTFGVTPTTGGHSALRFTGESLDYSLKMDASKEIRDDRMISDLTVVGAGTTGGINAEAIYREYDVLLEAALMGSWVVYGTAGVSGTMTLGINSTAGTLTASTAPTGNDVLTNLAVGQWFRLTAPGDAADGAYLKVLSTSGTVVTCDPVVPIPGTGTRAAVTLCKIASSRLKNGVTERSFSIERTFLDNNLFFLFTGQEVNKVSMDFKSGAITTMNFDFIGKSSSRSGATALPGTRAASTTFDVMNAVKGAGNVLENGAVIGALVKSLKFDLDNKLRARDGIGTLGAVSVGIGSLAVTGTIEVYLQDGTLYDKFVNNTATSLSWFTRDGAGNGYVLTFPKVKFSDAKVNAGSLDQDAMLSIPFTALMDPTTLAEIIIDRVGA